MNILFVCSANIDRSKTAEEYFSSKNPQHLYKSAGTNLKLCQESGSTPIDSRLINWADKIIVMEEKHATVILDMAKEDLSLIIKVLNISDDFKYMSPDLIAILNQKVQF